MVITPPGDNTCSNVYYPDLQTSSAKCTHLPFAYSSTSKVQPSLLKKRTSVALLARSVFGPTGSSYVTGFKKMSRQPGSRGSRGSTRQPFPGNMLDVRCANLPCRQAIKLRELHSARGFSRIVRRIVKAGPKACDHLEYGLGGLPHPWRGSIPGLNLCSRIACEQEPT